MFPVRLGFKLSGNWVESISLVEISTLGMPGYGRMQLLPRKFTVEALAEKDQTSLVCK